MTTKQIHKPLRLNNYAELLRAGKYKAIYNKQPTPIPALEFPADLPQDAASHIHYLIQKLPLTPGLQRSDIMLKFNILAGIVASHSYGDCIGYYYDEHFDAQLETAPLIPAQYYFEQMHAKRGLPVIDEYIITINTKSAMATLKATKRINQGEIESNNALLNLEIYMMDYFANNVHTVARESSIVLTRRANLFSHMNDFTFLMKRIELNAAEIKAGRSHTYGVTNCLARSYPFIYTCSENYGKYASAIRAIVCNRASNRSTKAAPENPLFVFAAADSTSTCNNSPLHKPPSSYSDVSPIIALSHCDELSLALTTIYNRILTLLVESAATSTTSANTSVINPEFILSKIILWINSIRSESIRLIARDLYTNAIADSITDMPQYLITSNKRKRDTIVAVNYCTQNEYYDRAIDVIESFFYSIKTIKFYLHDIRIAFDEIAKLITSARLIRYCEFSSTLAAIGALFGARYGFNTLATTQPHNLNSEFTRFMIYNSPQRDSIKKRTNTRVSVVLQTIPDEDHKSRFVVNYQNLYKTFYRIIRPDPDSCLQLRYIM